MATQVRRNALQKKIAQVKSNWMSIAIASAMLVVSFSLMIYLFAAKGTYGYSISTYYEYSDYFGGMPLKRASIIYIYTIRVFITIFVALTFIVLCGEVFIMIRFEGKLPSYAKITGNVLAISSFVLSVSTMAFAYTLLYRTNINIPWLG